MRRKGPIAGLLFMGVLIVLGTMGLVYGSWTESLSINGSVQTGTVNVFIFDDNVPDEMNSDPKGVALCGQVKSDTDTDGKNDKVAVTITNAFPGYQCHFWTTIENTGSLPVTVTGVLKNVPEGLSVVPSTDNDALPKGDCQENQLLPGAVTFCDWTVTVLKSAAQGVKYDFGVNITATLFNKPAS